MKFETLKDFWEWLTISTGDLETDFLSLCAYFNSEDERLLSRTQQNILSDYMNIKRRLYNEQKEMSKEEV